MFARISRYEVPTDRLDEATAAFGEAGDGLRDLDGFLDGYLLVESESGDLVTITFWRTRGDAEASRSRATRLRQEAVRAVEGSVLSVVEYEVVTEFGVDQGAGETPLSSPAR